MNIILRNSLHDLDGALDDMVEHYSAMMNHGLFFSGFQFIGILLENDIKTQRYINQKSSRSPLSFSLFP